ncbi:polyprenyl synthetase family protein [Actinosynnema sp. NPDC050436]|uniref:polyprenyl synthetase family protein n=1 Tax=Actinosynnema sp. NPDC050436 TaxID=3155659 RepID=UPI00340205BD
MTESIKVSPSVRFSRTLIEPALRAVVDDYHDDVARIVRYHFGWATPTGTPVDGGEAAGGKCSRGTLVFAAAHAVCGRFEMALPAAVGVELAHNSSIIHDDVIDGDAERRGRATVWAQFGTSLAVLAGDALLVSALRVLADPGSCDGRASALMARANERLIAGQVREAVLHGGDTGSIDDYLDVAENKTGALLECSVELGALFGGADESTVELMGVAARHMGIAWQAANDVEDIWGNAAVTGKPARSDLRRRIRTLPVLAALETGGPAARALAERWHATSAGDDQEVDALAELVEQAGGRVAAEDVSRQHLDIALSRLADTDLPPGAVASLAELFHLIVTRKSTIAPESGS